MMKILMFFFDLFELMKQIEKMTMYFIDRLFSYSLMSISNISLTNINFVYIGDNLINLNFIAFIIID